MIGELMCYNVSPPLLLLRSLSPLESYNSLQDHHLMGYYSNPKKLRHLRKMGLVSY